MPTMVMPGRGAGGGAGGAAGVEGGAPTIVGTAAEVGGCPAIVVVGPCAMRTEKTRSHWGQRTFSPPGGIFSGSTS
jgi:hypothetical protein